MRPQDRPLTTSQADQLTMLRRACGSPGAAVLLTGPAGAGKRTIAGHYAAEIGASFAEVPMNDAAGNLRGYLFGDARSASPDPDVPAPAGLLGRDEPTVVYLSGLQHTPPELAQELRQAISDRRYTDVHGSRWTLADDLVIIGARQAGGEAAIPADHWLWTAFDRRLDIRPPAARAQVRAIAGTMLRQYGVSPLAPGDRRLDDIVYALAGSGEGLTMLGRVLEHAAVRAKSGRVDHAAVLRAMRSDLSWLAAGVEYRGARLTEKALRQWLKQFPDDLQAVALQLVRSVAKDYFIGARDYFLALDHLIHESGLPRDAAVSFCVWQHVGTSAPAVAHRLKNQAKWRRLPDVDLRADPARWPDFGDAPPDAFLLVDDVVGTGNTLRKLIAGPASPVAELLRRFPRAQLRILVIAAFDEAIRLVRADLSEFRDRAALIPSRLLGRRDLCFSKESRILPNPAHRDRLAAFCRGNAGNRIRLGRSMRLGYQGMGAALVLHDTVPNFTLPLLWYENETWRPLFPAAGLADDR